MSEPTPTPPPEHRVERTTHPVAVVLGKVLLGRRPEDATARRRATIALIAITAVGIMGQLLRSSDARTDRLLDAQRVDLRESVAATRLLAENVGKLTAEMTTTRTTLLEKIPDAPPRPQRVRSKPVEPSR